MVCFLNAFSLFVYEYRDQRLALKTALRLRNRLLLEQRLCESNKRAHKHALNPEAKLEVTLISYNGAMTNFEKYLNITYRCSRIK